MAHDEFETINLKSSECYICHGYGDDHDLITCPICSKLDNQLGYYHSSTVVGHSRCFEKWHAIAKQTSASLTSVDDKNIDNLANRQVDSNSYYSLTSIRDKLKSMLTLGKETEIGGYTQCPQRTQSESDQLTSSQSNLLSTGANCSDDNIVGSSFRPDKCGSPSATGKISRDTSLDGSNVDLSDLGPFKYNINIKKDYGSFSRCQCKSNVIKMNKLIIIFR
ncbi:uncharacterized protein TRIADDRAFT_55202 [Trichoplax adhaerens]|uniref:Uncharacterized protein n=1 Tax=Trichoplax adhaerens TaxID=10228 RepID=B3RU93_TRIAD|nr:predicted protein [Trichoplax adhaerens]EDV25770.1 predicted protein [Trichoplax adhaerens]|eukprot:XP_002111803.1 predicted protein [Trichoplax adhaerens]